MYTFIYFIFSEQRKGATTVLFYCSFESIHGSESAFTCREKRETNQTLQSPGIYYIFQAWKSHGKTNEHKTFWEKGWNLRKIEMYYFNCSSLFSIDSDEKSIDTSVGKSPLDSTFLP